MVAIDANSTYASIASSGAASPQSMTTGTFTVAAGATVAIVAVDVGVNGLADTTNSLVVSSVTFDGVAMTLVPSSKKQSGTDGDTSGYVVLYYLLNPNTGATKSATVNFTHTGTNSLNCGAIAATFTGALQSGSELGTAQKSNGQFVSSLTITDTLATDDLFVGMCVNGTAAPTVSTGTSVLGRTGSLAHAADNNSFARNSGSGSVSLAWSTNSGDWSAASGVKLTASTGTGSTSPNLSRWRI